MEVIDASDFSVPRMLDDFKDFTEISKALENKKAWARIPLLNYTPVHDLRDGQLARFRGMVQDMQDPEMYLESYEVIKDSGDGAKSRIQNGKYRDCLLLKPNEKVNYDSDRNLRGERRTLFLVSIPGLNHWAVNYEKQCNNLVRNKITDEPTSQVDINAVPIKRSAPEHSEVTANATETMDVDDNVEKKKDPESNDGNKRQCKDTEQSANNAANLNMEYLVNSPIPERPSKACMVKLYKNYDEHHLNSIIDVVGFLSLDPALDGSCTDVEMDYENINEIRAQNPPPSLIPRLHAIAVHALPHYNPLLDERFLPVKPSDSNASPDEAAENLNMANVQKDLHILLKLCLFNDDIAADYLLAHLISTIYGRSELRSIGKFALNLCNLPRNLPADYTKNLYEILELLLPASHYLPLSLDTMNTTAFVPKKDYETNKLVSGVLQLAAHTHLVLDETQMREGKLDASGVQGIQHLAHLIKEQKIKCNFQFYDIDYNVNIPVLVLSEGRSMLPSDFILPLKYDPESVQIIDESMKAAKHYLHQHGRLDQFRRYLTKGKTWKSTMDSDETEIVHTDFVEMRRANIINTADDLHGLLVLSRLLIISRGRGGFDKEFWEMSKQLEIKRRERLQQLLAIKSNNKS